MSVSMRRGAHYCLVCATLVCAAGLVDADEQQHNESAVVLEEITISARKVTESAQNAPISISVLSGESLADRQITNVLDLQSLAPSLSIGPGLRLTRGK